MTNTKARHLEILQTAKDTLIRNGIDVNKPARPLLPLAKEVAILTNCHITTAKNNVAKAIRIMRGEEVGKWGGKRERK